MDVQGEWHGPTNASEMPQLSECCWPTPIPVSERLPELGHDVLGLYEFFGPDDDGFGPIWYVTSAFQYEGCEVDWEDPFYDGSERHNKVTHWLPLPPKPRGD